MASTQTQICNRALVNIARATIQNITENSPEAEACELVYADALEEIMTMAPWGFAKKTAVLAIHPDAPPTGWAYRYTLPLDMLRPRRLVSTVISAASPPLPFELALDDAGTAMTLVTDQSEISLEYTMNQTNEVVFPHAFVTAFAWRISLGIAMRLTSSSEMYSYAARNYAMAIARALTQEHNSTVRPDKPDPLSIQARGF